MKTQTIDLSSGPSGIGKTATSTAKRVAYADPPYIGQAMKRYKHGPKCAEVDHEALIQKLGTYDGWALSCSSPSLRNLMALCPPGVRVGAWVKTFCSFTRANPAFAWEP